MAKERQVSDEDENKILRDITIGEPVFLTKNGRGKYVIVHIHEYEKLKASLKLMSQLAQGELSGKEKGWMTISVSSHSCRCRLGAIAPGHPADVLDDDPNTPGTSSTPPAILPAMSVSGTAVRVANKVPGSNEARGERFSNETADGRRDTDADYGKKEYRIVREDGTLWEKIVNAPR